MICSRKALLITAMLMLFAAIPSYADDTEKAEPEAQPIFRPYGVFAQRTFQDSWKPLNQHIAFGLGADFGLSSWPALISISGGTSAKSRSDSGVDKEFRLWEGSVGLKKVFGSRHFRPYVGGGVSYVSADIKSKGAGSDNSYKDNSAGLYANGGILFDLGMVKMGGDLRVLGATSIKDDNANYIQAGLIVQIGM